MPQTPCLIYGKVYTSRGTVSNSIVIINDQVSVKTDSQGKYLLDLANMSDAYSIGTSYTITGVDEFGNEYVSDSVTATTGGVNKDLYLLNRTSDTGSTTGRLQPISIRTLGNKELSIENPLQVMNLDRRQFMTRRVSGSAYPKYIGYAPPGTPQSASKWIISHTKSNGEVTWANGNIEFDKVFDNYASYSYS